jgi:chorismate synthase
MSVQAMKGVEVGDAFDNARRIGTQAHDAMILDRQKSKVERLSNRAGGTEGGISNGQPIVIRAAMKPIATTLTPQQTVDLATKEIAPTRYERSDFCPVPRAVPILEAMVAFVLADALLEKLGGDSLDEMMPRFDALRKATLEDLAMDNTAHIFWE